MIKTFSFVLTAALTMGMSLAQGPAPQSNGSLQQSETSQETMSMPRFAPGTELRAELDKTIDTKKVKPGDPVVARTMDELKAGTEVIAPRGSKIIGHVVAVSPHEKGSPSRLEIAFDKLDLGNGSQIPLKAAIQALARPVYDLAPGSENTAPPASGNAPMSGARGMQPPGMAQPPGPPNIGNTGNTGQAPTPTPHSSEIAANAQGIQGMSGISLNPGPAQDSVLTSEKHNVKLDSGTQMVLRVE